MAGSQRYLLSVRQSTYSFSFSSRSSCWPCSSTASPPARPAGQLCVLLYPRESPESLPNSHPLSPRLSSAAVLRRLGHSLVVLRASLTASSSLEPESAWVLLRAPGEGWNTALGPPLLMSDGRGYLTWPHDPPRIESCPLSEMRKWEAEVVHTGTDAGDAEPRKRRKGVRSINWRTFPGPA